MNFTDISCFLNKLKIKQKVLEKNGSDFAKSMDENYGIVLDDNNTASKSQNEVQMLSLKKEVQENQKILQELKSIVSPENIPKIDLLALKHKMLTLEDSIQTIKSRITKDMENLTKEENILSIDVTNLEIKYSDINKTKFGERKTVSGSADRKAENLSSYQEVEDFTHFLNNNGGHEGGWSQNDHLIFLKYFNQTKSRKILFQNLQKYLPDFSEQKILYHIDWYTTYLSLREKQKEALESWRRNKAKKNKSSQIDASPSPLDKKNNIDQVQRQNVKEKISKWKLEKQQKLQQETENKQKAECEKKNKWKMKREMKNELKNDVGKWRASKQAQEKAQKLEMEVISLKEKERKIMLANALIREFQKQDSLYIMRRINKHNKKISNFFPPVSKESQSHRDRDRDPERIFKATRQWLSRISSSDNNDYDFTGNNNNTLFSKGPLNVQQIPKLRIPTWRLAVN